MVRGQLLDVPRGQGDVAVVGQDDQLLVAGAVDRGQDLLDARVHGLAALHDPRIQAFEDVDQAASRGDGNDAITGSAGFTLGANSLTASLTIGKPYILSFWAYAGSQVVVSGNAVLKKTGPTNNNFTYYEYTVAAGSAAPKP